MKHFICNKCGGECEPSKGYVNYHNIRKAGKGEFETKLEDCMKCTSCGHSFIPNKPVDKGLDWDVEQVSTMEKEITKLISKNGECLLDLKDDSFRYTRIYYSQKDGLILVRSNILGKIIINTILFSEAPHHVQKTILESVKETFSKSKKLVNFERLDVTLLTFLSLKNQILQNVLYSFEEKDFENLELFYNKLSQSSSFAHKAHKELKRLNK